MKRLLCILTVLCMLCTLVPPAFAEKASNSYHINGTDVRFDDVSSLPGECLDYAEDIYKIIWGHEFSTYKNDADNYLRDLDADALTLTEEHLKEYVSKAALGSCMRLCHYRELAGHDVMGHSQIIIGKDENGFTVFEGGIAEYPHCREKYYTWSEYINLRWLGGSYEYIKYIKRPHTPSAEELVKASGELSVSCAAKDAFAEPWGSSVLTRSVKSGERVSVVGYTYASDDTLWYKSDKGDYLSASGLCCEKGGSALPSDSCTALLLINCKSKLARAGLSEDSTAVNLYFDGNTVEVKGYAYDRDGELWFETSDGCFLDWHGMSPADDSKDALPEGLVTSITGGEHVFGTEYKPLHRLWHFVTTLPEYVHLIFD